MAESPFASRARCREASDVELESFRRASGRRDSSSRLACCKSPVEEVARVVRATSRKSSAPSEVDSQQGVAFELCVKRRRKEAPRSSARLSLVSSRSFRVDLGLGSLCADLARGPKRVSRSLVSFELVASNGEARLALARDSRSLAIGGASTEPASARRSHEEPASGAAAHI